MNLKDYVMRIPTLDTNICKKIVNQNNGEIWVESELGKGATFYFTLNTKPKLNTLFLIPAEVQGLSAELN